MEITIYSNFIIVITVQQKKGRRSMSRRTKNIMCRSEQKQERNIPHGQKQR